MQDFHNLRVWQKSHHLTLEIYSRTKAFPREEVYGLTSQMRRAAASVGTNIAEGCCRAGKAEMARFLQIAMGRRTGVSASAGPRSELFEELGV